MIGLYVSVPVACFRKGIAREYLETESLPPPATCYGFLLALVGECDRNRHIGCRVTAGLLGQPARSTVLRTMWRFKTATLGAAGNTRPDYQQLLTGVELVLWLDSSDENSRGSPTLEERLQTGLANPQTIERFGGLSLGESTHLVDEVWILDAARQHRLNDRVARLYVLDSNGRLTLPVWVDHVGGARTRFVIGTLQTQSASESPAMDQLPRINPE
jgi:CRISPR-associated protein Cas5t